MKKYYIRPERFDDFGSETNFDNFVIDEQTLDDCREWDLPEDELLDMVVEIEEGETVNHVVTVTRGDSTTVELLSSSDEAYSRIEEIKDDLSIEEYDSVSIVYTVCLTRGDRILRTIATIED